VVDHRRRAGVGGADHRPLQLEAPHARDLEMLGDGDRLAEPADVAEVGEDRRRLLLGHEARRQLLAEQVLVADVGRDPLAMDDERGRVQRPRLKSPSGMCISSVNQRKPVGMNSPNGTRWCLS
jgi:hypothetical protein